MFYYKRKIEEFLRNNTIVIFIFYKFKTEQAKKKLYFLLVDIIRVDSIASSFMSKIDV